MLHCGQSSMSLGEMTVKEQAETAPNGGGATRASPAEPAGRILSRRGTVVQAKFASRILCRSFFSVKSFVVVLNPL